MPSIKPRIYIPTLYFVEGLPYTVVTLMSIAMFKNLGASNEYIGVVTTNLGWPWVAKLLWAPLIDLVGTRRAWILVAHAVLAGLCVVVACGMFTPATLNIALVAFVVMAFVSATQDVAIDGYYMDVLDPPGQAFFVGVRNAAYKIAFLTGQGPLVMLAGIVADRAGWGIKAGWSVSFMVCAALLALAAGFHLYALPKPSQTIAHRDPSADARDQMRTQFSRVFQTFFTQEKIGVIVAYILLFRMGDALLMKMAMPFLLDPVSKGGLGFNNEQVGLIYGTVGTVFLLVGGIAGSIIVSRLGLKRCLLPAAIIQSLALPLYWFLALTRPALPVVACVNAFEQLSYGVGSAAYTVYLLSTVKPEYKASHYAIATGLMALGVMIPGNASGFLTSSLGYANYFLASFFISIPGIITILFLPFKDSEPTAAPAGG